MSIILKALKNSEQEKKKEKEITLEESFFDEGNPIVTAKPDLPVIKEKVLIKIGGPKNTNRVYVLAGVFVVLMVTLGTIWKIKSKDDIRYIPNEVEIISPQEVAANLEQSGDDLSKGLAAYNSGDYDKSLAVFSQAVAKNPKDPILHNNLALVLVKKGMLVEAGKEYEKALDLDDSCAECLNNYGMLKTVLNEPEEAKRFLEEALDVSPNYPDPYFNLAVLAEKEGDIRSAIKSYQRFIEIYPNKNDGLIDKVNQRIDFLSGK